MFSISAVATTPRTPDRKVRFRARHLPFFDWRLQVRSCGVREGTVEDFAMTKLQILLTGRSVA